MHAQQQQMQRQMQQQQQQIHAQMQQQQMQLDQMQQPAVPAMAGAWKQQMQLQQIQLDQMQQPRDAFKFLYGLVQEHCSNLVEADEDPGIARPTLDLVRKRHVERREEVIRGLRAG